MDELQIANRVSDLVFRGANPSPREVSGFTHYLRGGELRGDMAVLAAQISKGKMREIVERPVAEEVTP